MIAIATYVMGKHGEPTVMFTAGPLVSSSKTKPCRFSSDLYSPYRSYDQKIDLVDTIDQ